MVTLVTARSSGSSFCNRVELQNGCMVVMVVNCMASGELNHELLVKNLELAIDVYLDRVNHCECGDGVINLYKGADSQQQQGYRENIKIFLKGSKKKKEELKRTHADIYNLFESVWDMRERHLIKGYPKQYIYFLVCCFQPSLDVKRKLVEIRVLSLGFLMDLLLKTFHYLYLILIALGIPQNVFIVKVSALDIICHQHRLYPTC